MFLVNFILFFCNNNFGCYDYVFYFWEFLEIFLVIYMICNFIFYIVLCFFFENFGEGRIYGFKEEGVRFYVIVVNVV